MVGRAICRPRYRHLTPLREDLRLPRDQGVEKLQESYMNGVPSEQSDEIRMNANERTDWIDRLTCTGMCGINRIALEIQVKEHTISTIQDKQIPILQTLKCKGKKKAFSIQTNCSTDPTWIVQLILHFQFNRLLLGCCCNNNFFGRKQPSNWIKNDAQEWSPSMISFGPQALRSEERRVGKECLL